MSEQEYMHKGFERLDDNLISRRPPKIRWGKQFLEMTDARKIEYLQKLASTMNHAAALIQEERNHLGALCEKKEEQLIKLDESVRRNNEMLQFEVTRMNEQRQGYNQHVAKLNARIRELEATSK